MTSDDSSPITKKTDAIASPAESNNSPSAIEDMKKDKEKRKRSRRDDSENDEEWKEIKRLVTSDKKTLSSRYLASNRNKNSRQPYWLLVNPLFIKGEEQISEDEKKFGTLINLGDKLKKDKVCYMFVSTNRTRNEVLNYLRVASTTYTVPVDHCKFKKFCGDRPSHFILMNHRSRIGDRLMCIKYLSEKFPSLLIGQGLDGSFTKIHFSSRGQVSVADVDKTVKEYIKNLREQKRKMTYNEIENKIEELKASVVASNSNRAGLSKSIKNNFNRKFQMFVLDRDEELKKIKKFCKGNKNIVAAVILYKNHACLIRFNAPTKIKTLTSAIREKTGFVLKQKRVHKMKYKEARRFLQCHYLEEKAYAHGDIMKKGNNRAVCQETFIVKKGN